MLSTHADIWLTRRRAGGFALRGYERHLQRFATFAAARGEEHIFRSATAIAWAAQAATPGERQRLFQIVVGFARYLHAEDPRHEIPPSHHFPGGRARPLPYIYTAHDARRLVETAARLGPAEAIRPHTVSTVLALLFATGLRISEALALRMGDVTPDGLVIRGAKFGKTRLVPLHPSAVSGMARYLERRRAVAGGEDHVFLRVPGRRFSGRAFRYWWDHVLRRSGILPAPPARRPRIHDIRHTFAVRALESAPHHRDCIDRHMLAVSTYLGHSGIANTYWYFQATPSLMSQVADACQQRFERGLT
jgi:integrase